MNRKDKLKIIKNSYTQVAAVMILILTVALVPLLILGRYAHPSADDFTYGFYAHVFWSTTQSFSEAFKWALYNVKATYDTWQGTFSSVLLMSLSPAVWGEEFYFLTPIIMLFMIVVPHFFLLKKIIVGIMNGSKSIWIIISSAICFLVIENMVSPVEGLFWFNGAVHYVFMHGCMMVLFGLLINMFCTDKRSGKIISCIFACLFAVICGGAN